MQIIEIIGSMQIDNESKATVMILFFSKNIIEIKIVIICVSLLSFEKLVVNTPSKIRY